MRPPIKSKSSAQKNPKQTITGDKSTDTDEIPPSHNLWVGNLSNDTSESDLMNMFKKYGAIDSTIYASKNFGFIYFKRSEDARAAKEALQGTSLLGNPMKIEFTRPAKPGKQLWVGGISLSVSKDQLEEEFLKFGKIEELKFLRDRNSALVDYSKLEDAAAALETMNGKRLGGEHIRVDFLRSRPNRREGGSDSRDLRNGQFNNLRSTQQLGGRRGQVPTNVLHIQYPSSVEMNERILHNSMILFGEIEKIKCFPSRNYSFVEFRSVDEARRAKEGLQGRLFNDPRIIVSFSSSELASGKDNPDMLPGIKGPRPDMFSNEPFFGPGSMDFYGQIRPVAPNNFVGPLVSKGMPAPNVLMNALGSQRGLDQLLSADPKLVNELVGYLNSFSDANVNYPTGLNWRPSGPGILPSPVTGIRPAITHMSGMWDGPDMDISQRESMKSRIRGHSPVDYPSFLGRRVGNQRIDGVTPHPFGPRHGPGVLGPFGNTQNQSRQSPDAWGTSGAYHGQESPERDDCWRGVLAKGGAFVCHARCFPAGKGIEFQLPEIVNCSARTGLDTVAKYLEDATDYDIICFAPASNDDFASFTAFLNYFGENDRAGVARFDDDTLLFLVSPSDFVTKVLNVSGPERIYGVVLKLPQQSQQHIHPSQAVDRQQLVPSQNYQNLLPRTGDQVLQMDNNRPYSEDLTHHPPNQGAHQQNSSNRPASQDYASNTLSTARPGITLTPELIATLASIIPASTQASVVTSAQVPVASSSQGPALFPGTATVGNTLSPQGWGQDRQSGVNGFQHQPKNENPVYQAPPLDHQYGNQQPFMSQHAAFQNVASGAGPGPGSENLTQGVRFTQDLTFNSPQQDAGSSRTTSNFVNPSQGAQYVSQQVNQHFQYDASQNPQKSYAGSQGTDAAGLFQSPVFGQPMSSVASSIQVQPQSSLASAGQGSTDGDAEKNQRYQSTLQFAATLLQQIQQQQQQQQGKAQAGQGAGNTQ